MKQAEVAVIGTGWCGGIRSETLSRSALVDKLHVCEIRPDRLKEVQELTRAAHATLDYQDIVKNPAISVVYICTTPEPTPFPIASHSLKPGKHVLLEKPMALSTAECDDMIRASEDSGARLAVGLLRRFAPALRYTKDALDSGLLGTIRSFDVREGMVFRWPVKSAAMFSPQCGGVLADIGTHVVDLLLWWFGDVAGFQYWDDAAGGVEADAVMHVEMAGGITGRVELSRTRDLRNSCVIRGDRGTLEVGTKTDSTVTLTPIHGTASLTGRAVLPNQQPPGSLSDLFAWQMADFVRAVQTHSSPAVPGSEARRSVAILESCYRRRQRLVFPFESILANAATAKAS